MGATLHIGPLPGRKSIALYSTYRSTTVVLAYFRNEIAARRALNELDFIVLGEPVEDTYTAEES